MYLIDYGGSGGQVVNTLALYSDDPSLIHGLERATILSQKGR